MNDRTVIVLMMSVFLLALIGLVRALWRLIHIPPRSGPRLTICAWCGILLRDGTTPISHGICPVCLEAVRNPKNGVDHTV